MVQTLNSEIVNRYSGEGAQMKFILSYKISLFAVLIFWMFQSFFISASFADDYAIKRKAMIDAISHDAALAESATGIKKFSPMVMEALGSVPRHEMVPDNVKKNAYENRPLPIGYGQTISQPFIVALMTELLNVGKDDNVLEIGTGSGYQAAVLARLVRSVFTMEIVEPLGLRARQALKFLSYSNVEVKIGDGYYGWEEYAPFDAIIVTAAASHIPPPLVRQLKPGGRMVIPVGAQFYTQQLLLVTKDKDGSVRTRQILPVVFVPLTGKH